MVSQKITIEPVTRIEGHAKITIHLDGKGDVERAYLHINEFRGFEKFCEGRMYFEMPMITPESAGFARSATTWQPQKLQMKLPEAPRRGRHRCYAS